MKPRLSTRTTTGSTLSPGLSSVYNLNIVPELPPAPAERVDAGLAFLTDSLWSAAARLRIADFGPPGGDSGLDMLAPVVDDVTGFDEADSGPDSGPEVTGDDARGDACCAVSCCRHQIPRAHENAMVFFWALEI